MMNFEFKVKKIKDMKIIPAIDILNGSCVRLKKGDYDKCTIYSVSPSDVAKTILERGYKRIHVVDLDGAKGLSVKNIKILTDICSINGLSVDFGGGIKSENDLQKVFNAGVDYACIGSLAVLNVNIVKEWIKKYGSDKIILSVDVKDNYIYANGWKTKTGFTLDSLIETYDGLVKTIMCTDINKDGMMLGPNVDMYKQLINKYSSIKFIASGGVSNNEDICLLKDIGIEEVIVGKAFYEGLVK